MNKEELIKEYGEKAKALRDEFISRLEDDEKEFELSYPRNDHWVFCVDSDTGEIIEVYYTANNITDRFLFEHGYYFETKEEAEQRLKEQRLLFKIKKWAEIQNEGWELDWGKGNKYYIFYNYSCCEFETSSTVISDNFKKLPYFKSREIAQECIELFGEEIIEVFC